MIPTHIFRDSPDEKAGMVRAWQYLKTVGWPVWVCRDFHDFGDGKLHHASGHVVTEGQWIVDLGGVCVVLEDVEFRGMFKEVKHE